MSPGSEMNYRLIGDSTFVILHVKVESLGPLLDGMKKPRDPNISNR